MNKYNNTTLNYLGYFIRILVILYYYNIIDYIIIFINYKFLLFFNFLLLLFNKKLYTKYFLINKNFKNNFNNIDHFIVYINTTTKITKNNNIRKFSIISIIGNKNNWIGIGKSKHINLSQAVKKSYKNAFNNIIHINISFYNLLFVNLKFKKTRIILYNCNFKLNTSPILYNIFNCIGVSLNAKIIGVSSNIYNIINIIKKLSLLDYYNI